MLLRIFAVCTLVPLLGASSCRESSTPEGVYAGPHIAWQIPINKGYADASWHGVPAVADGRFYFAETSNITVLDVPSGSRIWTTTIRNNPAAVTWKIVAHGGRIFLPDFPDVFALDATTGQILWRYAPDSGTSVAEVAVDDHSMYVGARDHKVL